MKKTFQAVWKVFLSAWNLSRIVESIFTFQRERDKTKLSVLVFQLDKLYVSRDMSSFDSWSALNDMTEIYGSFPAFVLTENTHATLLSFSVWKLW